MVTSAHTYQFGAEFILIEQGYNGKNRARAYLDLQTGEVVLVMQQTEGAQNETTCRYSLLNDNVLISMVELRNSKGELLCTCKRVFNKKK